jgi:alpha-galactosidase
MPEIKITIVGGGSYNWSPILLCDLMHEEELAGSEGFLYDINLQAASEIKASMDRIAKDNGKDFTFTATDKEDVAYTDADFILVTISTGGLKMMSRDVEIPEKFGICQAVGDPLGSGGSSKIAPYFNPKVKAA